MKIRKGLALMLTLAMVISTFLTALPLSVMADDAVTVSLGAGGITNGSYVWFGKYNGNPISWRVLAKRSDSGTGEALLISNDILDSIQFNPDYNAENANVWSGSNAQKWCTNFLNNWEEGSAERAAIKQTSVTETNDKTIGGTPYFYQGGYFNDYYGAASLNNESFFFLSAQEADNYFADDDDRKATGADTWWWLRSPNAYDSRIVGDVDGDGWVNITRMLLTRTVRDPLLI